jgi:hypothetical protein
MRIRMDTTMAHPQLGVVRAGETVDLPEDDARALLEGGSILQFDDREFLTEPAASLVDPGSETKSASRVDELGALRHLRPR